MPRNTIRVLPIAALLAVLGVAPRLCQPAELRPETIQAFNHYVAMRESEMDREAESKKNFLWADRLPEQDRLEAYATLKRGEIAIHDIQNHVPANGVLVPGGLIHDWTGTVFVPGVTISQTIALLQNYDDDDTYYRPEVLKSKLLTRSGNEFHIFLRIKRAHIVTVVFDTEYDVRYTILDSNHADSRSYSTSIAEVEDSGQAQERKMPPGYDHGFLWRLYSYWNFYQADGGTYVQCEAISLTRDIPAGLAWIVRPFIESIPEESIRFTLGATRNALVKQAPTSNPVVVTTDKNR